jgi:riboflavin kinase/FMN adenylyltransferase
MRIFKGLNQLPVFRNPVVTIGTFDGVHLGHARIIERLKKRAAAVNGESILITFEPHPRLVLPNPKSKVELLTSLDEKMQFLQQMQLDNLVVVPFTQEFSSISAMSYIRDFLVGHFQPHTLVIGYDHHFGKDRQGNYLMLESVKQVYKFELEEIPARELEDIAISSTNIREALWSGNISSANDGLGRPYSLEAMVVHGDGRGKQIGFPTANLIPVESHKLIPGNGVYAVLVSFHQQVFKGMLNIGIRPTFYDNGNRSIEVHLLETDQNLDLYNQKVSVQWKQKLREERKFSNIEELIEQLHQDKTHALNALV